MAALDAGLESDSVTAYLDDQLIAKVATSGYVMDQPGMLTVGDTAMGWALLKSTISSSVQPRALHPHDLVPLAGKDRVQARYRGSGGPAGVASIWPVPTTLSLPP